MQSCAWFSYFFIIFAKYFNYLKTLKSKPMKRITLLLAAFFLAWNLAAQQFTAFDVHTFPAPYQVPGGKGIDTLSAPVFNTAMPCTDTVVFINMGTGYLTGNATVSGFSALECAQSFDNTTSGSVTGAVLVINRISSSGSGTFTAKVWNVDISNKPATPIATSNTVNMSSLTSGMNVVPVTFATNPSVNQNFAVGVVYPTGAGDTICVLQTRPGCVDALKDGYAHMNLAGTWMSYKSIMAMQVPPMSSFDLFISAIKNTPAEITENPVNATLGISPNPAGGQVLITSLNLIRQVRMLNSLGQTVYHAQVNALIHEINTSGLNTGMYFIQAENATGWVTKKLIINR